MQNHGVVRLRSTFLERRAKYLSFVVFSQNYAQKSWRCWLGICQNYAHKSWRYRQQHTCL